MEKTTTVIRTVSIHGNNQATLTIPKRFAKKLDLKSTSNVSIELRKKHLVIKKVEMK